MKKVSHSTPAKSDLSLHRLVILAIAAALATFCVAVFYPSTTKPVDETMELSFGASFAWIASQSFLLTVPGLFAGLLIGRFLPRTGALIGAALIFAVPIITFFDVITFTWIGERFISRTMHQISTTLAPALMLHVTRSTFIDAAIALTVGTFTVVFSWWIAGIFARTWVNSRDAVGPVATSVVLTFAAMAAAGPAAWNLSRTFSEMEWQSTRHPFCAFHLVGYRGVGVSVPHGEQATLARLRGLQSAVDVQRVDRQLASVDLDETASAAEGNDRELLDVIVIVAESLRPEIIDPEVMPNLHAFAEKSIWCKQHFSEGNSTSYGVFGLLNGIESIWFDRPVCDRPILNRVLHQAGYELGFFGGEDDWEAFGMSGYVRAAHFDAFEIEYPELLDTDYRAVSRNLDFIVEGKRLGELGPEHRMPRFGITYLLATHCRYISEEEDQIFQPAAEENFVIPYSANMAPKIYNRYKNSARTVDRMIKPLLRDDCMVIVMGDHGESFLEDGTAIHGLRLSKYQNMTPMMLYYPGVVPRTIEQPTTHADIFPTMLSILGLEVTKPDVFDGVDLTTVDQQKLANRVFTTANFMDRTMGLIGPWTLDPKRPFAYRFLYDIGDWQIEYLNPIDERGYACDDAPGDGPGGEELFREWVVDRVGKETLRNDKSEDELFEEFFHSDDRETRLSAIRIANDIAQPEPYLYDLIAEAARDEDPEIRTLAKDIIIRTQRYRTQPRRTQSRRAQSRRAQPDRSQPESETSDR